MSCERLAPEQGPSGTGQLKAVQCGRNRDAKCQESQTVMHRAAEHYYTRRSNFLCHLHLTRVLSVAKKGKMRLGGEKDRGLHKCLSNCVLLSLSNQKFVWPGNFLTPNCFVCDSYI